MVKQSKILKAVITGMARSKFSLVGGIMCVVLFPILIISVALDMQGFVQNPYFSFLIYMIMGPLFCLGIILVFIGLFFRPGKEEIGIYAYEYLREQFNKPGRYSRIRKLLYLTTFITIFTLFVVAIASYAGFRYTESVGFCAQFCHSVMKPEYVTYQNSPHSRVPCVECHIGESAEWFTKSKFSGIKQLFAVAFHSYSKPIPTPIGGLRPERATCEKCHRPEKFHGDKLYVKDKFLPDEYNTHVQTALLMKVGAAGYSGREAHGIHWHVSENHQVFYKPADRSREEITQVALVAPDNRRTVFLKNDEQGPAWSGQERVQPDLKGFILMDCIDCHNRPTHIYLTPDEALDQKLVTGAIPRQLPYIKKKGLEVITAEYPTTDIALRQIARDLRDWYKENYPDLVEMNQELLDDAVRAVQQAYAENVFPSMNIGWGTYKDFIGHQDGTGCFRCHGGLHESRTGAIITEDCDACHIILAEDQPAADLVRILKGEEQK